MPYIVSIMRMFLFMNYVGDVPYKIWCDSYNTIILNSITAPNTQILQFIKFEVK